MCAAFKIESSPRRISPRKIDSNSHREAECTDAAHPPNCPRKSAEVAPCCWDECSTDLPNKAPETGRAAPPVAAPRPLHDVKTIRSTATHSQCLAAHSPCSLDFQRVVSPAANQRRLTLYGIPREALRISQWATGDSLCGILQVVIPKQDRRARRSRGRSPQLALAFWAQSTVQKGQTESDGKHT